VNQKNAARPPAAKLMMCRRASKGQSVFRIAVQYPDGTTATGWAKLGTWAFGLLSDVVNVRWDNEKPQPPGFPVILAAESQEQRAT
jgi:hypothetical protein